VEAAEWWFEAHAMNSTSDGVCHALTHIRQLFVLPLGRADCRGDDRGAETPERRSTRLFQTWHIKKQSSYTKI